MSNQDLLIAKTAKKGSPVKSITVKDIDIEKKQINLAVIGCGYWGPKLIRNFAQLKKVKLNTLCDLNPSKAYVIADEYALNSQVETDYLAILNDPKIDGVVIATPAPYHFHMAQEALKAHKHVFVEKPLAMSVKECSELIRLAKQLNLVLMVGHVFRYNNAVQKIKEYIDQGLLGNLLYIHSRRLNLGRIQKDINAMWSFAPHDISILLYWLGEEPVKVTTKGFSYLNHGVEDVIFMTLEFPSGVETHTHLSWLHPKKVREMAIMGSEKMLIYDDVAIKEKIQIYDKCVASQGDSLSQDEHSYAEFQTKVLYGNVTIPYLPFTEPLQLECQHFIDCIRSGTLPLTSGQEGLRNVRVMEAAQKSLNEGGIPVEVIQDE